MSLNITTGKIQQIGFSKEVIESKNRMAAHRNGHLTTQSLLGPNL
jgi:hypothetical protein